MLYIYRLNLIYAKRAVAGPINGLIRYPRLRYMLYIYLICLLVCVCVSVCV
jgi:hypothetical protein